MSSTVPPGTRIRRRSWTTIGSCPRCRTRGSRPAVGTLPGG